MPDLTTSASYTAVDLSRLPAPTVIDVVDYEATYATMAARVVAKLAAQNPPVVFDPTNEADPAVAVLQEAAYNVTVLQGRVNDAAKAVMTAYATGGDLDQLLALMEVQRLVITPADPDTDTAEVDEDDDDFRRRGVLAPEGFSVAGPEGAYKFHSLSADSSILDASAISPNPCEVLVSILTRTGDGSASADLVAKVQDYLASADRRPLTDLVTVQSAQIVDFQVIANITTFSGPDPAIVLAASRAGLDDYISVNQRLGRDITRSAIFAALHTEGVQNIVLISPADDIVMDRTQAGYCSGITIANAGIGE